MMWGIPFAATILTVGPLAAAQQAGTEVSDPAASLLQYGAIGLIAFFATVGAVYLMRRNEAITQRFIDYLETKGSTDAALQEKTVEALKNNTAILSRVERALENRVVLKE